MVGTARESELVAVTGIDSGTAAGDPMGKLPDRNASVSSSKLTSRSHVDLNSLVVLRKSAIVLPIVFAICGSFRGPRNIKAMIPMRISSEVPIDSRINKYTLNLDDVDQVVALFRYSPYNFCAPYSV